MAGTIDFGNETSWECSGGTFRDMVAGVTSFLSDSTASLRVSDVLSRAIASGLMFVQYDRVFDAQMGLEFLAALQEYLVSPVTLDKENALNPTLHDGYIAMLRRLCELVRKFEESRRKQGG